ncbi:phage tail protein [Gellertiella hungarica]|uniref:Phage protein U n=1 Tax=Gellertiella hungarica TaxID=1572859 RepID=A0A7W6J7L0_9HYPH|nr:phage tail protein [Gellertiella hungarica]MBB4066286.1 phage protein U [Gellertiella hungarica]
MSVFRPHGALLSIGGAILYTVGLNPQRIGYSSTTRFPVHSVQAGFRVQATGADPERIVIDAQTYPHVVGGMDAYAILKAHHRSQSVVPFIRLRGNYLGEAGGLCVIETLDTDEERLHPFDGVGRKVDVSVGLMLLPATAGLGGRLEIVTLGGLFG